MVENWQDQVPFYVSGTMPPHERAAFEAFLAQSAEARQAVDDWRMIANEVYQEADSRAGSLPPLSPKVRAQLNMQPRVATNGRNHHADLNQTMPVYHPPRAEYQPRPQPQVIPQTQGRYTRRRNVMGLSLSFAAAMLLVCFVGLGLYALGQGDNQESASSDKMTATPNQTITVTPTLTTVPNLSECNLTPAGGDAVNIYADPNASSEVIGTLAASERLIAHSRDTNGWYAVGGRPGWIIPNEVITFGECDQLPLIGATLTPTTGVVNRPSSTPFPKETFTPLPLATDIILPTPTAAYQQYVGIGGYPMVTIEDVGDIPAGIRVRLSYSYYDGVNTFYGIVAEDEQRTADAKQSQLTYAPDVTPGPLPTMAYGAYIGMGGYPLVTTEGVGSLPAGTRVRISHAEQRYNGWVYIIVGEDEVNFASAWDYQLAVVIDYSNGTSIPTPTALTPPDTGGEVTLETLQATILEVVDTGFPIKTLIVTSPSRATEFQVNIDTTGVSSPIPTMIYSDGSPATFEDFQAAMTIQVTGFGLGDLTATEIIIQLE